MFSGIYPNQSATTFHKLQPRSLQCVFIGYPRQHRGYKCLDLATNRVIFSRHVTFDENSFPFSVSSSPSPSDYHFLDDDSISPAILHEIHTSSPTRVVAQPPRVESTRPISPTSRVDPPLATTRVGLPLATSRLESSRSPPLPRLDMFPPLSRVNLTKTPARLDMTLHLALVPPPCPPLPRNHPAQTRLLPHPALSPGVKLASLNPRCLSTCPLLTSLPSQPHIK